MDMDMDVDVPLPEELELLEESYIIHDQEFEHLDLEPSEPYPYEDEEEEPTQAKSPAADDSSPSPGTLIHCHKRSRSLDGSDAPVPDSSRPSDEKRSRIADDEEEEEWLRYSPSKVIDPVMKEPAVDDKEETLLWRFASDIDGDFIPVTAPSGGDRVYAKMSIEEMNERREKLSLRTQSGGLIEEPINVLLQRVEQEAFTKALQASSGDQNDLVLSETPVVHEKLWVDKYAPNSFTELLSDEQTNREVLLWLKQWDSCVFGSEIRSTSNEVLSALRRHLSVGQHQKFSNSNFLWKNRGPGWNKENFRLSNDFEKKSTDFDQINSNSKVIQDLWNKKSRSTGPPEQKILLLCGPPGLGKTTLAHVAARHCGYRVVEINASDDRSASTIEAKILDVVQMNSVTSDSRPKCLVIDEIDGALGDGKGAVEVILKMVSDDKKSDTGKENAAKEENPQKISAKKGRKSKPLSRPVICICNDLYAPVLRPLRQVARVHVFAQPTVSRIVSRLKYICNKEAMKTSSIALAALADYTECDIRSCLNTLQFLHKKKENLNMLDVSSQVIGRKDMSKSVFDVWKGLTGKVVRSGDYELIMDGVHENILQLPYHDPVMQKTVKCLNCLGISDLLHQYTLRRQQMHLLAYQPALAITVHRSVAQVQRPNIEWPKSYLRYRTMLTEKMDTLRSWYYTIPPYISRHLSIKSFVEEAVSLLLHILSPPTLRPVALNLLSENEKNDLDQLVSKMITYSITYKNVKLNPLSSDRSNEASDTLGLAFDPPIADFVNFKGYRSGHYVLALAMKQVLVHEVEKQRILQVSTARFGHLIDGCNKENEALSGKETGRLQPDKASHAGPCAKSIEKTSRHSNPSMPPTSCKPESSTASLKLKPSGGTRRSSGLSSFFDRFRKLSKDSQNTDTVVRKEETSERDLRPLLFKFNEGFTNAVKRPVRVREFLL
ncbi:Chromosome transmission fidelity protein 18-like protein [Morus notabilis]|uniref:Chromosome transmission fidelity protein 18 homolog n=1 Tax=Morus notabilis TaxID=981085 RepID=W9S1B0_9ROSA|nr:Chromosome transmission fidelity protein 18-like protein [Morus notabilis]